MPAADLFPAIFEPFSATAHFSDATTRALQKNLRDKNGKAHLKCLVRGKEVMPKSEEVETIIDRAGFPVDNIFHVWKAIVGAMGKPTSRLVTQQPRRSPVLIAKVCSMCFQHRAMKPA